MSAKLTTSATSAVPIQKEQIQPETKQAEKEEKSRSTTTQRTSPTTKVEPVTTPSAATTENRENPAPQNTLRKSATLWQLEKEQREKQKQQQDVSPKPVTPVVPVEPVRALTEEELISHVISFVFQVSLTPNTGGRYFLQDLAKELTDKPLLAISNIDSLLMETVESKRREENPGMLLGYRKLIFFRPHLTSLSNFVLQETENRCSR